MHASKAINCPSFHNNIVFMMFSGREGGTVVNSAKGTSPIKTETQNNNGLVYLKKIEQQKLKNNNSTDEVKSGGGLKVVAAET